MNGKYAEVSFTNSRPWHWQEQSLFSNFPISCPNLHRLGSINNQNSWRLQINDINRPFSPVLFLQWVGNKFQDSKELHYVSQLLPQTLPCKTTPADHNYAICLLQTAFFCWGFYMNRAKVPLEQGYSGLGGQVHLEINSSVVKRQTEWISIYPCWVTFFYVWDDGRTTSKYNFFPSIQRRKQLVAFMLKQKYWKESRKHAQILLIHTERNTQDTLGYSFLWWQKLLNSVLQMDGPSYNSSCRGPNTVQPPGIPFPYTNTPTHTHHSTYTGTHNF